MRVREIFILHSDQFKPKSYLKLIKKYVFSEGEQFPLTKMDDRYGSRSVTLITMERFLFATSKTYTFPASIRIYWGPITFTIDFTIVTGVNNCTCNQAFRKIDWGRFNQMFTSLDVNVVRCGEKQKTIVISVKICTYICVV